VLTKFDTDLMESRRGKVLDPEVAERRERIRREGEAARRAGTGGDMPAPAELFAEAERLDAESDALAEREAEAKRLADAGSGKSSKELRQERAKLKGDIARSLDQAQVRYSTLANELEDVLERLVDRWLDEADDRREAIRLRGDVEQAMRAVKQFGPGHLDGLPLLPSRLSFRKYQMLHHARPVGDKRHAPHDTIKLFKKDV
jgi:hypothetical protein